MMDLSVATSDHPIEDSQAVRQIHTYHCLCTHLLLASTTPLNALPRRSASSLDKAYTLSLPPPPGISPGADSPSDSDNEPESSDPTAQPIKPRNSHYALLLSTILDRKPQIIRRSDGFEKRYLQRCGRCRIVVGYQLDWAQFGGRKEGRREDVVYLLPGGLVTTEEMAEGRDMSKNIGFGDG